MKVQKINHFCNQFDGPGWRTTDIYVLGYEY
jgi:hypothetical protein